MVMTLFKDDGHPFLADSVIVDRHSVALERDEVPLMYIQVDYDV